jgi:hypothetical protein
MTRSAVTRLSQFGGPWSAPRHRSALRENMRAIQATRAHFAGLLSVCFVLCAVGVWVFCAGTGKNGFDSLPLAWYCVLVLAPVIAVASVVAMWRVRVGSDWWLWTGVVLLLPQLYVLFVAASGVLHYLGIINHGFFW